MFSFVDDGLEKPGGTRQGEILHKKDWHYFKNNPSEVLRFCFVGVVRNLAFTRKWYQF